MKRWSVLFIVLSLLMPVLLTACGGGDKEEKTPTPAFTATHTSIVTATAMLTTAPSGQVKIGAIVPWSGPAAMSGMLGDQVIKLVEWQVKQQGGILGGKEVKVVKYDNRNIVTETQAGCRKLYYEENVSAIVWGGTTVPEFNAGADMAEELKVLFIPNGEADNLAELKYTVNAQVTQKEYVECAVKIMTKLENVKTMAFFAHDTKDSHTSLGLFKPLLEAAGIKIVYEAYVPLDATDYSSYLTKIKYDKPDYLYIEFASSEPYITVAKQMIELGGWGNMKVGGNPAAESAAQKPNGDGWYVALVWFPGSTYPGSVKFETGLKAIIGRMPSASYVYFYMCLWTAIHAIELAGTDTDREAIVQAARSGKLEWESPAGLALWKGTDQFSTLGYQLAHAEGGKLVQVQVAE